MELTRERIEAIRRNTGSMLDQMWPSELRDLCDMALRAVDQGVTVPVDSVANRTTCAGLMKLESQSKAVDQGGVVAWAWKHVHKNGDVLSSGVSEIKVEPTDNTFWDSTMAEKISTVVTPLYPRPLDTALAERLLRAAHATGSDVSHGWSEDEVNDMAKLCREAAAALGGGK